METRNGPLLDLGCGAGFILSQTHQRFQLSIGIDMSMEALRVAARYVPASFLQANAEQLPYRDGMLGCVVSTDAFEHIPDDQRAFEEVWRVLRPGGCCIVYVPSTVGLLSATRTAGLFHQSQTSYLLDQRYYTVESLCERAEKAGFAVEYVGYHNVFMQEFFTQSLKTAGALLGKRYESQADIGEFVESRLFVFYRYLVLPLITLLVRLEEALFEGILKGRVPGHRIVIKCRRPIHAD